jgi:hypothetical protein
MTETIEGKYRVELVTQNGEGDCGREVLYRHDNLSLVRAPTPPSSQATKP